MILIRPCQGFDELQACVDLEIEVWGYCEGDVIPRRVFLVSKKIGGQVIGAFDTALPGAGKNGNAGSLIGFSFSLPGVKNGAQCGSGHPEPYLHSHMLAVRETYRNQSIGRLLKLEQRREALARGLRRIEWTFDPLEIKNAFLNIHKLGAIVRTYEENFYGVSSSRLQGGLQTDRLVAEWWLDSSRVTAAIAGKELPEQVLATAAHPSQVEERQIKVPASIYDWKASNADRPLAEALQTENRIQFQRAFQEGFAVVAFTRDSKGDGIYHLKPWS